MDGAGGGRGRSCEDPADAEIDEIGRAAEAQRIVEPWRLREQQVQAEEGRGRPDERAGRHRRGRDQSGRARGADRRARHREERRPGARRNQQMDRRERGQHRDTLGQAEIRHRGDP